MSDLNPATLAQIDAQIRQGRISTARQILPTLSARTESPSLRARYANLCWRAGLPELGLRALFPRVRGSARSPGAASDEEKAEYAACLIKIRASDEALLLLDELAGRALPVAVLYRSFALVSRWEYEASIANLQDYLGRPRLPSYSRLVAQVNLAAALVYERHHRQATPLLRQLLHELSVRRHHLLLGRTLELCAENFVLQRKPKQAKAFLAKAESFLHDPAALDAFFIRKYQAIAHLLEHDDRESRLVPLDAIRREAIQLKHWETVRDCDRWRAASEQDRQLAVHVWFGTPYESFRGRFIDEIKGDLPLPDFYDWSEKGSSKETPLLDLSDGSLCGRAVLKVGKLLHRCLWALSSDFYRPVRVATLHGQLYRGEHFSPASSPSRIYEAIRRLRQWLADRDLPLEVNEDEGAYRLVWRGPCILRVPRPDPSAGRRDLSLDRLRRAFAGEPFSAQVAANHLGLSTRSALRLLKEAVQEGLLQRRRRGNEVHYTFGS